MKFDIYAGKEPSLIDVKLQMIIKTFCTTEDELNKIIGATAKYWSSCQKDACRKSIGLFHFDNLHCFKYAEDFVNSLEIDHEVITR